MNTKTKKAMMYVSLVVLVLASVEAVSAKSVYYFTDDAFKAKFGEGMAPTPVQRSGTMVYVNSEAFYNRFGEGPFITPDAERLPTVPGSPEAEPLAQEPDDLDEGDMGVEEDIIDIIEEDIIEEPEEDTVPVIVIPILNYTEGAEQADAEGPLEEDTAPDEVPEEATEGETLHVGAFDEGVDEELIDEELIEQTSNETEDMAEASELDDEDSGIPPLALTDEELGEEALLDATEDEALVTEAAEDEIPEDEAPDAGDESSEDAEDLSEEPSAAVIAGDEDEAMQIMVIGFLVVVIAVMLVVLLSKKEGSAGKAKSAKVRAKPTKKGSVKGKNDWEEGDFLKPTAKAKPANAKPKAKAPEKPESAGAPAKADAKPQEVKPFLLKIKDEV
jgi:hypothetical protein